MKIVVSERDIEIGKNNAKNEQQQSTSCPVYVACKRQIGDDVLYVNSFYIALKNLAADKYFIQLPIEVINRIYLYDRYKEMEPFEFEIP